MSTTNCEYIVGGFRVKQYDKSLTKDIIKTLFNSPKNEKLSSLFPNLNPTNIDTYINIRENLPDYTYDLVINNLNLLLKEPLSDNAKKELVDELNTLTPIYNQLFIDNPVLYQYGSKQQLYAITNNEELKQMTVDEIIQLLKDNKDITPNPNKLAHIDRETQANPFINEVEDKGSLSYVVFNPNQVTVLNSPVILQKWKEYLNKDTHKQNVISYFETKFNLPVEYDNTIPTNVSGYVKEGKVYLNPNIEDKDLEGVLIEEFTHVLTTKMEKENPSQFEQLFEDLLSTSEYKDIREKAIAKINTLYPELSRGEVEVLLSKQNEVSYSLKAINIISNNIDKINKWYKQTGDIDKFWSKIQQDLQIPKEQIKLLRESEGNTVEEKLASFAANYSYNIEINISTGISNLSKDAAIYGLIDFEHNNVYYQEYENIYYKNAGDGLIKITREEFNIAKEKANKGEPTQYYSNLTVAGGTNYTENEIATPAITPSIKGHAQFATDNGIGWFRSDEEIQYNGYTSNTISFPSNLKPNIVKNGENEFLFKLDDVSKGKKVAVFGLTVVEIDGKKYLDIGMVSLREEYQGKGIGTMMYFYIIENLPEGVDGIISPSSTRFNKEQVPSIHKKLRRVYKTVDTSNGDIIFTNEKILNQNLNKTRRILEVQSDLFQKGRDKEDLSETKPTLNNIIVEKYVEGNTQGYRFQYKGDNYKSVEIELAGIKYFKNGNFISNEEWDIVANEVNSLNNIQLTNKTGNQFLQLLNKDNNWVTFFVKSIIQDSAKKGYEKVLFPRLDTIIQIETQGKFKTYEEAEKYYKDENWHKKNDEAKKKLEDKKNELKIFKTKELSDIEKEYKQEYISKLEKEVTELYEKWHSLQPTLLNTAKFYENDLGNILKKNYKDNIKEIVDEYGNGWYELTLTENMANTILLSKQGIIDNNNTQLPEHIYQSYKHELIGQAVSLSTKNIVSKQLTQILGKLLEWIKDILSNIGFTNIKTINTFKDLENVFKSIDTRIDLSPNDNNFNMNKHLLQQDTITNEKNTIPDCL